MFTVEGRYQARGWTEWTQGFQFGSALLQFDATGDAEFLELGRDAHARADGAAPHPHRRARSRLQQRQHLRQPVAPGARGAHRRRATWERRFYELALKVSGAVQARRWTPLPDGGFIHSFNGAHSLFVDTIRSLRALALGHSLGQRADGGAGRARQPARPAGRSTRARRRSTTSTSARGRDRYDVRGRTAHESLFNVANGTYRGPSTQQGYSPFTHLDARAGLGDARVRRAARVPRHVAGRGARVAAAAAPTSTRCCSTRRARPATTTSTMRRVRRHAVLGRRRARARASSATGATARPIRSTITSRSTAPRRRSRAQGLLRLGRVLTARGAQPTAIATTQAGLRVARHAVRSRAVSEHRSATHQGLLLHSVYHWPNGWDHVPAGRATPRGESSQWGDYHAREAALYVKRLAEGAPYLTFFGRLDRDERTTRGRALVTGGTRGIGLGIARALARRGLGPRARRRPARSRRARARSTSSAPPGATVALRRRRPRAAATIAPASSPSVRDAVRRRSTRSSTTPAARRAVRADLLDAGGRELRGAAPHEPAGPVFPDPGDRPRAGRAAAQRTRRSPRRSSSSRRCRRRWPRSTAASTASARPGCRWRRGCSRRGSPAHGIPVYEVRPGIIATDMTAGVREVYDRRIADGLVPERRWGTARRRRPRRRGAAARRRAVRHRQRHPRRRRPVAAATLTTICGCAAAARNAATDFTDSRIEHGQARTRVCWHRTSAGPNSRHPGIRGENRRQVRRRTARPPRRSDVSGSRVGHELVREVAREAGVGDRAADGAAS